MKKTKKIQVKKMGSGDGNAFFFLLPPPYLSNVNSPDVEYTTSVLDSGASACDSKFTLPQTENSFSK